MQQHSAQTRLVVLSVDGMQPSLYQGASKPALKVPNLGELAASGASAEAMESVYPSSTYPAHATLVTGVAPRVHGIYSHLTSLDPTERARPWHWFAAAIRVPALWNLARVHSLSTAAVSWPVSVGAPIDYNIPEIWDPSVSDPHQDLSTVARYATPGLFDSIAAVFKPSPRPHPDQLRGEAGIFLWRNHRPDVMFIHFVGYDQQAHRHGPSSPQALQALEQIDREIGRIREAVESDERATLVVVSDHGFLPVEREIAPLVILKEEGLFGTRDDSPPELKRLGAVHTGGSLALFWLEEPTNDDRRALDRALSRLSASDAISEIAGRARLEQLGSDPDAEWILDAADGYCFSGRFDGAAVGAPATDRGAHGHLPSRPGMEASFIASGKGVAPGRNLGRIQLTDVAPTLVHLLGLSPKALAGDSAPLRLSD